MYRFGTAAALASLAACYDQSRSITAAHKMKNLSNAILNTEKADHQVNTAEDVIDAINDLKAFADDVPGIGLIVNTLFPGNDTTKQIMEELDEIEN